MTSPLGSYVRGYYDQSYPPSVLNPAPPVIPATGATAGTPGTFTPAGSTPPADVAGMTGLTASPTTAWTVGQYVQTGTAGAAGQAHWDGAAWVAGPAVVTGDIVAGMTIDDVKAFVTAHPDLLSEVYGFEQTGKKRAGLLSWLKALLDEE